MQRVTRAAAVAIMPAPPASPGAPGYFTGGDPTTGQAATPPGYEWYNTVQEELIAILAAAGIAPDRANNAQLLAAIKWLVQGQTGNFAADTGTANSYAANLSPAITAPFAGLTVRLKISNTNTGASTFSANGAAAAAIKLPNGADLSGGELVAGMVAQLVYSGTYYQLLTVANAPTGVVVFASGTTTWTVPAGVYRVKVRVWGGGGGGAGSNSAAYGSGGGGGGGYAEKRVAVTPGQAITVTVGGQGPAGNYVSSGGAGGTSSFGAYVSATGGAGGTWSSVAGTGGAGGSGSAGDLNITGQTGGPGIGGTGGAGGSAPGGGSGAFGGNGGAAGNGIWPGGGGGGYGTQGSNGPGTWGAAGAVEVSY